jgi:hypothetical protein
MTQQEVTVAQDVFIVAIDLGGFTVPALMTYSADRWRGQPAADAEELVPAEPEGRAPSVEQ